MLGGVVVSYGGVRVLSSVGVISYARPYIHFPISASFLVFRAVEGQLMRGVVSQVGPEHVGVLIHGVFSAVISASHLPPHFRYVAEVEVEGGRVESMMLDSRSALPAQLRGSVDPSLSRKAEAKLRKAQAKEQRRADYAAAHGGAAEGAAEGAEEPDGLHRHIRVGSVLHLAVLSVHSAEGFVSLQGSLTAEGAELQPGEPIRPRAWRAREAIEEAERRKRAEEEANSVERLFGVEAEADSAAPAASQPSPPQPPSSPLLSLSQRERRERKRTEKAERRAAKAQRKLQRREKREQVQGGVVRESVAGGFGPVSASAAAERSVGRVESVKEEVEAFRRAEGEAEGEEDDSNVVLNEDFSHIEEHRITEDEAEPSAAMSKRRRERDGAEGQLTAEKGRKRKKKSHGNGLLPH